MKHWDVIDVADEKLKLELQELERRNCVVHSIFASARKGYTRIVSWQPIDPPLPKRGQ